MVAIGPEGFRDLLAGFHAVDEHFAEAPLERNVPVLMGLLGVWYRDFFGTQTHAVLPYEQYLARFPAYLQQLEMESNGKRVTLDGEPVAVGTAPVVWGEPGTNGQHASTSCSTRGRCSCPADFIAFARASNPLGEHHDCCSRTRSRRRRRSRSAGRRKRSAGRASWRSSCLTR